MAKQPTTPELSLRAELEQLERRREELRTQLRSEHEGTLQQALRDFNGMNFGVTYELREVPLPSGARRAIGVTSETGRKGTRSVSPVRPCPICGFRTNPPHDARAHRSQGDGKQAFSAEELDARGMQRVG